MYSRRNFLEGIAAGVVATALSSSRVLGANERIRLGIIGPGARGKELMRFALACPSLCDSSHRYRPRARNNHIRYGE